MQCIRGRSQGGAAHCCPDPQADYEPHSLRRSGFEHTPAIATDTEEQARWEMLGSPSIRCVAGPSSVVIVAILSAPCLEIV